MSEVCMWCGKEIEDKLDKRRIDKMRDLYDHLECNKQRLAQHGIKYPQTTLMTSEATK